MQQVSRRKPFAQEFLKKRAAVFFNAAAQQLIEFFEPFDLERRPFNDQGIVPIRLDQVQKADHMAVPDIRVKPHVVAPVLVDVPVISVALRVERRCEHKMVIITFGVAMFTAINVKYDVSLTGLERNRQPAAQNIIKKGLAGVQIEFPRGAARETVIFDLIDDFLVAPRLSRDKLFIADRLMNNAVKPPEIRNIPAAQNIIKKGLAGVQIEFPRGAARETVIFDL